MATLLDAHIAELVKPYLDNYLPSSTLYSQLSMYLDLLLKWNARTNLTAIRDPEDIIRRHFGESLFAGTQLSHRLMPSATLLDYGSGAGFPGLPIQLLLPELRVTLAESQGKKASFLREVVRTLGLATEVWAARVDTLPDGRLFDAVTLRAVDNMQQALIDARFRVAPNGYLVTLCTEVCAASECIALPGEAPGWLVIERSA